MTVLADLAAAVEPAGTMRTGSPPIQCEGGHDADRPKKQPQHRPGNRRMTRMADDARRDNGG